MILLQLAQEIGLRPKLVASTAGGEYHSACPLCGGKDRFYLQPNKPMSKCLGAYRCRQCNISGDSIQFAREFLHLSFQQAAEAVSATLEQKVINQSNNRTSVVVLQPPIAWVKNATTLVTQSHISLLHNEKALTYLNNRGLPLAAVEKYKFGWIDKDIFPARKEWGLDERSAQGKKTHALLIPRGILIPFVETTGQVTRLKVRRSEWHQEDQIPKYVVISGSMNGLNIIGSVNRTTVIIVESEFDAYAIDFVAGDFVCAIAAGSSTKNPDIISNRLAKTAHHLLICHDNDKAGNAMFCKWRKHYSHAIAYPTPVGKDIGEAVQNGLDPRQWLMNILKHTV